MKTPKEKKIKTYVLTVSEYFPKTHPKSGAPTNFIYSIGQKLKCHTIRGNYKLWQKRISEIQKGNAVLSIRTWSGVPYQSTQTERFTLSNQDGVGIQKIKLNRDIIDLGWVEGQEEFSDQSLSTIAHNDGLSIEDFRFWFEKYDFSEPMAIIHFTAFRYE